MRRMIIVGSVALGLAGCSGAGTMADVCATVAQVAANPVEAAMAASADPALWADLQLGCAAGVPPAKLAPKLAKLQAKAPKLRH